MFPTQPEIEPSAINPAEPWKFDELGREDHIRALETMLLTVTDRPMTLAVDSGWGTGKSTLLRMWQAHLTHKKKKVCVLFNAWETDFAADPLVAFVQEIYEQIDQIEIPGKAGRELKEAGQKFTTKLLPILGAIAKTLAKMMRVDVDAVIDAVCEVPKDPKFLEAYREQKQYLVQFRKALTELVADLSTCGYDPPLIILVDELDRCRPNYAVQLLERIKHLFSVPGVIFVLAVDRLHLVQSVNQLYGLGKNGSDAYLRRFVDLDFRLPSPDWDRFIPYITIKYDLEALIPDMKVRTNINDDKYHETLNIFTLFTNLCFYFTPSLRDFIQIISQLVIVIRAYSITASETVLLSGLLFYRKLHAEFYYQSIKYNLKTIFSSSAGSTLPSPPDNKYLDKIGGPFTHYFNVFEAHILSDERPEKMNIWLRNQEKIQHSGRDKWKDGAYNYHVGKKVIKDNLICRRVLEMLEFVAALDNQDPSIESAST